MKFLRQHKRIWLLITAVVTVSMIIIPILTILPQVL